MTREVLGGLVGVAAFSIALAYFPTQQFKQSDAELSEQLAIKYTTQDVFHACREAAFRTWTHSTADSILIVTEHLQCMERHGYVYNELACPLASFKHKVGEQIFVGPNYEARCWRKFGTQPVQSAQAVQTATNAYLKQIENAENAQTIWKSCQAHLEALEQIDSGRPKWAQPQHSQAQMQECLDKNDPRGLYHSSTVPAKDNDPLGIRGCPPICPPGVKSTTVEDVRGLPLDDPRTK